MEKLLDLKTVSKTLGVSVKTLQRWDAQEKIKVVRTPGGRRRIPESEAHRILGSNNQPNRKLAIYSRVSSNEQKQKEDL
ncbi:TPA: recombinase family protein, partial [Bacillus pseudomycoides]|nr:recombinase family protein [Bacillus pseudomycoides]